jgi:hypothetical protein
VAENRNRGEVLDRSGSVAAILRAEALALVPQGKRRVALQNYSRRWAGSYSSIRTLLAPGAERRKKLTRVSSAPGRVAG